MFRARFLVVATLLLVSAPAVAQPPQPAVGQATVPQPGLGSPRSGLQTVSVKPTSWTETTSLPAEGGQVLQTYSIGSFVEQAGVGSERLVVGGRVIRMNREHPRGDGSTAPGERHDARRDLN